MPIPAGTRIGSYEVLSAIGSGGMGEVYRASDTKLKRDVAIKVLPARSRSDPERLARFSARRRCSPRSTIRTSPPSTASKTATRPRTGDGAGRRADPRRSARSRRPPRATKRCAIARQIAGRSKPRTSGIVHRDLKPANIKVTTTARSRCWTSVSRRRSSRGSGLRTRNVCELADAHPRRHASGHHPRHRRLHGAGAGARAAVDRRAELGVRLRALRDADRAGRRSRGRKTSRRSSPPSCGTHPRSTRCRPTRRRACGACCGARSRKIARAAWTR